VLVRCGSEEGEAKFGSCGWYQKLAKVYSGRIESRRSVKVMEEVREAEARLLNSVEAVDSGSSI